MKTIIKLQPSDVITVEKDRVVIAEETEVTVSTFINGRKIAENISTRLKENTDGTVDVIQPLEKDIKPLSEIAEMIGGITK